MKMLKKSGFPVRLRFNQRWWNTEDVFDLLALEFGVNRRSAPLTSEYRIMIAAHRIRFSERPFGKGYGQDWKTSLKEDLERSLKENRPTYSTLIVGTKLLREAQRIAWAVVNAEKLLPFDDSTPLLVTAE